MWCLLYAVMVLYIPFQGFNENSDYNITEESNGNGYHEEVVPDGPHDQLIQFPLQDTETDGWQLPLVQWFEEQLQPDLRWSFALNRYFNLTNNEFLHNLTCQFWFRSKTR